MPDDSPLKSPAPIRARRWSGRSSSPQRPRPYRFALRLIGIPAAAVAAVLVYRGVRDRFVLPACDSDRAKHSLADVLKQLRMEPTRYEPIKTVSSTKDQIVCNAELPLPDGGSVATDFTFYWEGGAAHMKYSVSRKKS
ncbi:MAG: hypothetical protein WBB34_09520 [Xanthobacteraceae bacterium]